MSRKVKPIEGHSQVTHKVNQIFILVKVNEIGK